MAGRGVRGEVEREREVVAGGQGGESEAKLRV